VGDRTTLHAEKNGVTLDKLHDVITNVIRTESTICEQHLDIQHRKTLS